jgi:hypothetical protein
MKKMKIKFNHTINEGLINELMKKDNWFLWFEDKDGNIYGERPNKIKPRKLNDTV